MAQFIENLKKYFKNVSDRRFLEKFEDKNYFFRAGYEGRVRWFELVGRKERVWALEKGYVRDAETLNRLFPKYANLVAPYMNLRDEQFAVILQEGYMEGLEGYVKRSTLSISKVRALISATIRRAGKDAPTPMSEETKQMPDLLYRYIVREGLPQDLCPVAAKLSDETIKGKIADAVNVHYHIMAVKDGYNKELGTVTNNFETYLLWMEKENVQMPYAAEILMNGRQLHSFYSFGHHLSKEAIVALFASCSEYDNIIDLIMENEVLYPAWPELEYTLKSSPYNTLIYAKYQSALCSGMLKKEANS